MRKSSRRRSPRRINYGVSNPRERSAAKRSRLVKLLSLFAGVVLVGLYFIYDPGVSQDVAAVPTKLPVATPSPIATSARINLLVLGIDRRITEKCPCRSDTMMIATMDPDAGTAGVITIPRDLWVPIPGIGEGRINEALFYGDYKKLPGEGPALAKQTVEYNLGVKIDNYVIVDFATFRKALDILGGIDIDVPVAIDDPTYPDEYYGYRPLHIPAGRIHMNGDMALAYARTRHGDNDFGRSRRQIQVLLAVRDKALRLDLLPKLPSLFAQFQGGVDTDVTLSKVLALAPAAIKIRTDRIKTGNIDDKMTVEFRTATGSDVLWPDRAKISRLIDSIIPPAVAPAEPVLEGEREVASILIENGTTNLGLGQRTAKYLQSRGFRIVGFGNADRTDYSKSILVDYGHGKSITQKNLQEIFHLGSASIRTVPGSTNDADFRLILGADWSVPQ